MSEIEIHTGARFFLNGIRLIEGLDWLSTAARYPGENSILLNDKHPARGGNNPGIVVMEDPQGQEFVYIVTEVEPYMAGHISPWNRVVLREVHVHDELRAAYQSLPK